MGTGINQLISSKTYTYSYSEYFVEILLLANPFNLRLHLSLSLSLSLPFKTDLPYHKAPDASDTSGNQKSLASPRSKRNMYFYRVGN